MHHQWRYFPTYKALLEVGNKEFYFLDISPSALCFVFVPRSITALLISIDQLTMIKLKIKLILTWKGRGPSVPGCGERFPGLTGAGAGAGA
jgi:hypothetical protein